MCFCIIYTWDLLNEYYQRVFKKLIKNKLTYHHHPWAVYKGQQGWGARPHRAVPAAALGPGPEDGPVAACSPKPSGAADSNGLKWGVSLSRSEPPLSFSQNRDNNT